MKKFITCAAITACFLTVPVLSACGGANGNGDNGDTPCVHQWVETGTGIDATCTTAGTVDWKCSLCDETKTTVTDKLDHTEESEYSRDDAYHWKECSVCDTALTQKQPHKGGTPTLTNQAECEVCHAPYGDLLTTDIDMKDFITASGRFTQTDKASVTSTQTNSLAVKKQGEFKLGTLSCKLVLSGTQSDNGIVFGVTNPQNLSSFWEENVSYYFFFVSRGGTAYLGKVTEGAWSVCGEAGIPNFDHGGTYTLKVERNAMGVKCYVDNVLYVTYNEALMLKGTGYGIRAGSTSISFSELYCNSTGDIPELEEGNLKVVTGGTAGTNEFAVTTKANTLAFTGKQGSDGTFSFDMTTGAGANAGLVFGMTDDGKRYYTFSVNAAARRVELTRHTNGASENIYSNYLSAGFSAGAQYEMKVVLTNGKVYAYFNNILYLVKDVELSGDNFGIYSSLAGSQFSAFAFDESESIDTCDTLFFGHSYFELWSNWKEDIKAIPGVGTYNNIGIGGSIASHWNIMKDAILAYRPSTFVYMIGINDITGGVSPYAIADNVQSLLYELKAQLPELKGVLLSVNYCPAREQFRARIEETNELYRTLCAKNDWLSYAEMLTAFCDTGTTPADRWFTDGLHPSAAGYTEKIVPAIISALKGENQPTLSEEDLLKALADAKEKKKCVLLGYDPDAYNAAERERAKEIYDRAITAIDACASETELAALDLAEYIDELKKIPNRSQAFYAAMKSGDGCHKFENTNFTTVINNSDNGKLSMFDFGHRLYGDINAADLSFTFRMSDLTGESGVGGILFRTTRDGDGVKGYLINYVTRENYLQIWYLDGAYGGTKNYLVYIGGWVFPAEVEDTLFRAVVENDTIYLYTETDYLKLGKNGYGCSVALDGSAVGMSLPVYGAGMLGVVNWQDASVTYKLEIGLLTYRDET